ESSAAYKIIVAQGFASRSLILCRREDSVTSSKSSLRALRSLRLRTRDPAPRARLAALGVFARGGFRILRRLQNHSRARLRLALLDFVPAGGFEPPT
ncbi:hypothetical protein D6792_00650, partial [Candidatus Parcubacteria bacterium]